MGLWIRSQDKEMLIKCNNFSLTTDNKIITNYKYVDGYEYYECLGTYSSKEQALKVLDLIQGSITGNKFNSNYEIMRDCQIAGIEYHGVFQMPQDSEVEINE